ncbi:Transposon Ty3-I Gag-Pol polyprotein, partial [Frankliniella fusca]
SKVESLPDNYPSWKIENNQLLKLIVGKEGRPLWNIVVPREFREKVLLECHDSVKEGGHGGINKTWNRVRGIYYWPGMKKDIASYIAFCTSPPPRRTNPPRSRPAVLDQPEDADQHLAAAVVLASTPGLDLSVFIIINARRLAPRRAACRASTTHRLAPRPRTTSRRR